MRMKRDSTVAFHSTLNARKEDLEPFIAHHLRALLWLPPSSRLRFISARVQASAPRRLLIEIYQNKPRNLTPTSFIITALGMVGDRSRQIVA